MKHEINNAEIIIKALGFGIQMFIVIVVCIALKYATILITESPTMRDILFLNGLTLAAIIYKLITGYNTKKEGKEKNGKNPID